MPVREIIKYPNPVLRKKAKALKKVDGATRKLINDMAQTMYAAPGVGLAAPQVGESVRVIVVDIGKGLIAMVNPKIKKRSGQQVFVEGCLSLPNLEAPVKRPSFVVLEGQGKDGKKIILEAEGLLATVLQHEIDHLDGKVFIDRVEDPALITPVSKKEAEKKGQVCLQGRTEECLM